MYITSLVELGKQSFRTFNVLYLCTYFHLDICLVKEVNVGLGRESGRFFLPQIVCVAISNRRNEQIVRLELNFKEMS